MMDLTFSGALIMLSGLAICATLVILSVRSTYCFMFNKGDEKERFLGFCIISFLGYTGVALLLSWVL